MLQKCSKEDPPLRFLSPKRPTSIWRNRDISRFICLCLSVRLSHSLLAFPLRLSVRLSHSLLAFPLHSMRSVQIARLKQNVAKTIIKCIKKRRRSPMLGVDSRTGYKDMHEIGKFRDRDRWRKRSGINLSINRKHPQSNARIDKGCACRPKITRIMVKGLKWLHHYNGTTLWQ